MADGFGGYISFFIQDNAAVDNEIVTLQAIRNGADNTGKFVIQTGIAGAFGNRLSIDGTAFNVQSISVQINGTTVLDTSRNLSNIGTIASGAINTTGDITITKATANLFLKDGSTGFKSGTSTVVTLQSSNALQSASFTTGTIGWSVNDAGDAEFANITARGALRTSLFLYNAIATTGGTTGTFKSAGKLRADVTVPSSPTYGTTTVSVDVDDKDGVTHASAATFAVNDIIRMKDGLTGDTWFKVSAVTDQTTFWRYTCIIMAGTNNVTYRKGMALPDYGQSGDGFIIDTADAANAPYTQMATHAATFTSNDASGTLSVTAKLRIGNLNGSYGYASNVYGFAVGEYGAASKVSFTLDPTNGFRVINNTTVLAQWDNTGAITIGEVGAAKGNILLSSGTVQLRVNTTANITLNTDGTATFAGNVTSTATITGGVVRTASSGKRVVINESGTANSVKFYSALGAVSGEIAANSAGSSSWLEFTGGDYVSIGVQTRIAADLLVNPGSITVTNGSITTDRYVIGGNIITTLYASSQEQTAAGAVAAVKEFTDSLGADKIRIWYRHRTGNQRMRASALLKNSDVSGTTQFKVIVNGSNGSTGSVTGTTYAAATSTYDVTGLTDGTLYEVKVYLADAGSVFNAYMKQVVVDVESSS